jgi:OmpA-OmpF porin, OOP family
MRKLSLVLLFLFGLLASYAQHPVEGTLLSIKKEAPITNELIIFKSFKTNNKYEVFSDENGKFSIQIPPGDKYQIYIMSVDDSSAYHIIEIPANANPKNPFMVHLQFEPSKIFVLKNVQFEYEKSEPDEESHKTLDDLVKYLQRKSTIKVEISGHTDNIGRESKNHQLSEARAKAIVDYLIAQGIEKKRLSYKGYGSREPIDDNNTEAGRQKNRRIEVRILN